MNDSVIWHSATDRGAAEALADLAAVSGATTSLVTSATETADAVTTASRVIVVVSAAALNDRQFDGPVAARLDAGLPTLVALLDMSTWEFTLRRPRWASQIEPAQVLDSAIRADRQAWTAWLASASPEVAHPESSPATRPTADPPRAPQAPAAPAATAALGSAVDPSALLRPPAWITEVAARAEPVADAPTTTPALPQAEPADTNVAVPTAEAPPQPTVPAPAVPPRSRRRARHHASQDDTPAAASNVPRTASRTQPRRPAGCACLQWVVGLAVAAIVLVGLAIGALIALSSLADEEADNGPVIDAVSTTPTMVLRPSPTAPTVMTRAATTTVLPTHTRTPSATASGAATGTPAVPAASTPVRVMRDTFSNAALGTLPRAAADGAGYRLGYEQGEYVVAAPAGEPRLITAALAGDYSNVIVAIDARLIADPADRQVLLTCRGQGRATSTGYSLRVNPDRGQVALVRWDDGRETLLATWRAAPAVRQNNQTNRVEFRCIGPAIAGVVNGATVASAVDRTHRSGSVWLGVTTAAGPSEARFDNLSVTALPGGE